MSLKNKLLTESKFEDHDWKQIVKDLDAEFIHMHPERGEVEFNYNGTHYLIEHENGKIKIFVVKFKTSFGDEDNDKSLTKLIKGNIE